MPLKALLLLLIHTFFGQQVTHIKVPPVDAYREIDRIQRQVLEALASATASSSSSSSGVQVVVLFMGVTEMALQLRLQRERENAREREREREREAATTPRLFTLSFGSLLDALSGYKYRGGLDESEAARRSGRSLLRHY